MEILMEKTDISLILASRNRTKYLESLLQSVLENTTVHSRIEVIILYDEDDTNTKEKVSFFENKFSQINPTFFVKKRSNNLNQDYINFGGFELSKGELVFVLNDDVVFKTYGWEQLVWDKYQSAQKTNGDKIFYGMPDDDSRQIKTQQNLKYCCFPVISRTAANALGYFMHPMFRSWGADIHLFRIYDAVKRTFDLSEVTAHHFTHYNGNREPDSTDYNARLLSSGSPDPSKVDIQSDVKKLSAHVSGYVAEPKIDLTLSRRLSALIKRKHK